jgi:hypothetical protein
MPNIFERARAKREAEGEEAVKGGESKAHERAEAAGEAPKVDFFRPLPKDPEKEAAKKKALLELLRNR